MAVVLLLFLGVPLLTVLAVSFFDYDDFDVYPAFLLTNYIELFTTRLTLSLYLTTLKFAAMVWALTLLIGFLVAYFLVFHVRTFVVQIALFLLCTIPFWTSSIIRMISWIPVLGREGLFNRALMGTGVIDQPLDFLLYSDFAVVLSYVHSLTLFMIVPIFNSMARIDRSVVEAAVDGGASRFRVMTNVIIPLSRTGIALGSIFVIALVMGDFFIVRIMSGGQSASVAVAMYIEITLLLYPPAAASAIVLLLIVVLMVAAILRVVDIRKEIAG